MADAEVVKYNKTIEKLCVDCAADVGRELAGCKQAIKNRLGKLSNDIIKVFGPERGGFVKGPRSNRCHFCCEKNSRFAKRLANESRGQSWDGSGRKLALTAWGVGGPMALI